MLKHTAETDNLSAAFIDAIAYYLVVWVEGRGYVFQRTVLIGFLHTQFLYVEAIVNLKVVAHMTEVESVEACLSVAQRHLHLAHLQHLAGMVRTDTQRLTTIDDILAQS